MDDITFAGALKMVSGWISALGDFAYNHIGLTLILFWCFILFVMTETAKPFIKLLFKGEEREEERELVVKAFPQFMGVATGWAIFPALVGTTPWGAKFSSLTWGTASLGSLGGLLVGWLTIKIYMFSKNGKVIRFTKVVVRKIAKRIPFLGITDKEIEFIETTVRGKPAVTEAMLEEMMADHPGSDDEPVAPVED